MIWDCVVVLFIIAFSYAFTFKEDIPKEVTYRSLLLMLSLLVILNIGSIINYFSLVLNRAL